MTFRYRLERSQWVPRPRDEVFAFFARAENLERLTPAFLRFRILTPGPIRVAPGTLIDYRLRLHGVPIRWRTRIETFVPGESFTDVQLSGPYKLWHHRHEFEDEAGGTRVRDVVDYELPLGPLGALAHGLFVGRRVQQIFDYRQQVIARMLGARSKPSEGGFSETPPPTPVSLARRPKEVSAPRGRRSCR
jgi:ligand-binding SRPBCC domain-containing protein